MADAIDRTELAPLVRTRGLLATLAHVADAHVLDAQSPARVPFLARLGGPFALTFRPQEALTAQVLAGAIGAVEELGADAVVFGGDLIDNAQHNELERALAVIGGGNVEPGSGGPGYRGMQSAGNADAFYYRPEIDVPRHPGLLERATEPFHAAGLTRGTPWYPVLGDHDLLVQGVAVPGAVTQAIATGDRAVWELPAGLQAPIAAAAGAPDGLAQGAPMMELIARLQGAPTVAVAADPARRELSAEELLARLRAASAAPGVDGPLLDYSFDVGAHVRGIVLDLVRREGGSGGIVHPGQREWLAAELARAGERWVLVFCHQPLTSTAGADALLEVLDIHPRMLAAVWAHTHRHEIVPRRSSGGGYWLISTASLIDHPQQARALQVLATEGGGAALRTWPLDWCTDLQDAAGSDAAAAGPAAAALAATSRELALMHARAAGLESFAGGPLDRAVTLYRRAA